MDAIIFDIDGTLADVSHRVHHVKSHPKDWDAFFDAMGDDPPIEGVTWLADKLTPHADIDIFLVTGRPEKYREKTIEWIQKNITWYHTITQLRMRADGDYRSDTIVKREILHSIQERGYTVRLAIDDRPSVIAMWKEEGIPVLQVPNPDWDDEPILNPGRLTLMVGHG